MIVAHNEYILSKIFRSMFDINHLKPCNVFAKDGLIYFSAQLAASPREEVSGTETSFFPGHPITP